MTPCPVSSTRLIISTSCRLRESKSLRSRRITQLSVDNTSQIRRHSLYPNTVSGFSRISSRALCTKANYNLSAAPAAVLASGFWNFRDDENTSIRHLSLFHVFLAFTLGFVAAPPSHKSYSSSITADNLKVGGENGGGSPLKPPGSVLSSRARAEEDVQEMEKEASGRPHSVSSDCVCTQIVDLDLVLQY